MTGLPSRLPTPNEMTRRAMDFHKNLEAASCFAGKALPFQVLNMNYRMSRRSGTSKSGTFHSIFLGRKCNDFWVPLMHSKRSSLGPIQGRIVPCDGVHSLGHCAACGGQATSHKGFTVEAHFSAGTCCV